MEKSTDRHASSSQKLGGRPHSGQHRRSAHQSPSYPSPREQEAADALLSLPHATNPSSSNRSAASRSWSRSGQAGPSGSTQLHKCPHRHCGKSLTHREALDRHIRTVHDPDRLQSARKDSQKRHTGDGRKFKKHECGICGLGFAHARHLTRHRETVHLKKKEVTCDACGRRGFRDESDLKRHKRAVHEMIKDKACGFCGRRFALASNLKTHVDAVHLKIKDKVCGVCGRGFAQASHLNRHIRAIHKDN